MRRLLTDRFCTTAKAREGDIQTDYFDEQNPGLALRVSRSGLKSWTLHFTQGGKRNRMTFGNYPAISLGSARSRADEARALLASGYNPRAVCGDTMRVICEDYMKREGSRLRTAPWHKWALEGYVYPTLGDRPIAEIRRSEISRWLDQIEEGSGAVMADRTLAIVRRIMNWHAARSDDFRSPIVRGMARTKPTERARNRILSDDEIRAVWRRAERSGVFGRLLQFLLLTAARRSEAAEMRRTEITDTDWILPATRNKVGIDLVRPLSRLAQSVLPETHAGFIFSQDGVPIIGSMSRLKRKFDVMVLRELGGAELNRWTVHDLRRTARSLMSRAKVPSDHAERCLGHVIGGVRGTYDRHEYYDEKKRAFEALAALIERIVSKSQGDVVQLKGRGKR